MPNVIGAAIASFKAATAVIGAGIGGATATGIGASLVKVGLNFALMTGINALTAPKVKSAPAQLSVKVGAVLPRTMIMGRTAVAGMAVTPSMYSGNDKGVGSFVRVLSGAGESGVVEKLLWDDEEVTISANPASLGGSRWIKYNTGGWSQTAININSGVPSFETGAQPAEWTTNHRCLGCMTVMMMVGLYNEPVKSKGIASKIAFVVLNDSGTGLIDPRTGITATGSAKYNPFVWAYSYALGFYENSEKLGGGGLEAADINTASFSYAANVADTNSFTIAGELVLDDTEAMNNLRAMAQAGGGDITTRGGKLYATVAATKSVVYYIREDDFRGVPKYRNAMETSQVPNSIIPRFRSSANGYELVDGTAVTDATFLSDDNSNPRVVTLELPYADGATAAGKLAALALVNAREKIAHSLPLKTQCRYSAGVGDCVEYDTPNYALDGQKIMIGLTTINPDLSVDWDALNETDSKYAWALGQSTTAPNFDTVAVFDPTIAVDPDAGDWTPTATTISGGGVDQPIVEIAGAAPYPDNIVSIVPFISPDIGVTWLPQAPIEPNETLVQLTGVTPETDYDVGIAYVNQFGVQSTVVNVGSITTDPIGLPAGFTPNTDADFTAGTTGQTAVGDGWYYEATQAITTNGGAILIAAACQSQLEDDPAGTIQSKHSIRIRRGTTTIYQQDNFAKGADTSVGGAVATPWSATIVDAPAAGTYTYYLQSIASYDAGVNSVRTIGARSLVVTEL